MNSQLINKHITDRLKRFHIVGLISILLLFVLLYSLDYFSGSSTLIPQLILLLMGTVLALSMLGLMVSSSHDSRFPLITLFVLNILTSVLVWATGILQSPFILLYAILILVSSQLFHYRYGLLQTLVAIIGFATSFILTSFDVLPFYSLLAFDRGLILVQPPAIITTFGFLYAFLLLMAAFSSSTARMLLYRPMEKVDMDITYQEKIIQEMPLGVLIVDAEMTILGSNNIAQIQFPFGATPSALLNYLDIKPSTAKKTISLLAKNEEEKQFVWKTDNEENRPVVVSARQMFSDKKKGETFILFIHQP